MSSTLGSGKSSAKYFDAETLDTDYGNFLKILSSTEPDLQDFMDGMSFAGFNKAKMAKLAAARLGARRTIKLVFLAAYRGTNLTKIIARSVKVDDDVKKAHEDRLILSNGKGPEDLTMGRLLACFPQFAAYYMMRLNCPKKIVGNDCPACLQFPAAASLPMSVVVRTQHIEFCKDFSDLIGSKFDPKFYIAAFKGAEDVTTLHSDLREILGNPTNKESNSVDVSRLLESVKESRMVIPTSKGGISLRG